MKKIFSLLLSIALLLGVTACNEPLLDVQEEAVGPLVDIYFTLRMPELLATKDMSNQPQIQSVWVAEFGAAGYFKRWAKAVPTNGHIVQEGAANGRTYKVELPLSSAQQRFHIIAGYYSDTEVPQTYTGETETEVINGRLETTGKQCAYWQRIVVPNGIRGTKNSDGTYEATAESQAYFASIPLVRNFAKINVYSKDANFTVLQYALVNVPAKGKVAPYDANGLSFVGKYSKDQVGSLSFTELYNSGNGYKPQDVQIITATNASSLEYKHPKTNSDPDDYDPYLYMYERPIPTENSTCVLVQIRKGSSSPEWFKIEVLDSGMYVPIYRDFVYGINIGAIDATGESTAQAALDGSALGSDVSSNLETASLTSISDGSSTLQVGYTDYVGTGETSFLLSYDYAYPTGAINPKVTVEIQDPGSNAVPANTTFTITGTSGVISVPLSTAGTSIKKSVLRVTGSADNLKPLYRDVYVRVIGQQQFGGSVSGGSQMGNDVTLSITLPSDLGRMLFPITLFIEADDNSLSSTDSDMPVKSGTSPVSNKQTFWFVRTISYTTYASLPTVSGDKQLDCHFKRNKAVTGTTSITVMEEGDTHFARKVYSL